MSRFLRAALGKTNQAKDSTSTQESKLTESAATTRASVEHVGGSEHNKAGVVEPLASESVTAIDVSEKKNAVANVEEPITSVAEKGHGKQAVEDDESKYLSGWKLAPLTFGLCLATFVVALDNTVSTVTPEKWTPSSEPCFTTCIEYGPLKGFSWDSMQDEAVAVAAPKRSESLAIERLGLGP